MLGVTATVREALEAFAALERFLAAVQALVLSQVVFVLKRLLAYLALVGPLTCNCKVGGQLFEEVKDDR